MSVDTFIEHSSRLLQSFPASTTLSITYSNVVKKQKKSNKNGKSEVSPKYTNAVKFKLYEAQSGKVIKFTTHKSKELSKLLNFIGPNGVSNSEEDHKVGLASIMSNVKYEKLHEEDPVVTTAPAAEAQPVATSKNKKKKKKGKK